MEPLITDGARHRSQKVRVIGDEEGAIVDALNALRHRYTYVFTTGGSRADP
jgi:molybdopterin-biosynthesis enzyme MoeA-like protein